MSRSVELLDITVRDAQQCLWATRMSTAEMTPIARTMDDAGFLIVDLLGGAAIDACVMYLREDPFERLRTMRRLMPSTPLNFNSRGQSLFRWRQYADDVIAFTFELFQRNGIRSVLMIDAVNDFRNLRTSARVCKSLGLYMIGGVTYTISPVHTDAHFVEKTRELVALGFDAIEIKDPSGLLTPERARTLVPAMKRAAGTCRVMLHSHCTYGHGIDTYLAAMDLPAEDAPDTYFTASEPLAWGYSLPPQEEVLAALGQRGIPCRVDPRCVAEMRAFFSSVALQSGRSPGRRISVQPLTDHQVPGGMLSNLERMLADQGQTHRLPEVLEEIGRVRADLGYPIMVSPLSQYVGTQAVFNVLTGDRYSVVPEEIRRYVLGWYGRLAAPVDPGVRERIAGDAPSIEGAPGDLLEPEMERHRREHGPFASDEDLALSIFYSPETLRDYRTARLHARRDALPTSAASYLVQQLLGLPDVEWVEVRKKDFYFRRQGTEQAVE